MIIECCEKDYRKYEAYNYSGLKLFAENPYSYYNKYVLKQKEDEGLSDSVKIGMLVDCLLLEKERFTLGMPTQVSEDWASLLYNDNTSITVGEEQQTDLSILEIKDYE